ncbi:hypothetical protein [Cellulomonas sp. JZ18]|uniref:hypothetical protein n=1 Tax=Cellulomonas sp. JZ18 TaxID=2654191 RepID=UPI001E3A9A74|nr:hypothetical protein [Cellulomonas sp. JZ18]
MTDFAARGGGVLLSSHLMAEVAGLVDRVVLIDRGRVVEDRPLDEVLREDGLTLCRSLDDVRLAGALARAGVHAVPDTAGLVCRCDPVDVGRVAAAEGVVLVELRPVVRELADFVLERTRGEFRAGKRAVRLTPADEGRAG